MISLCVLQEPPSYGSAYEQFGGSAAGARACEAIAALVGVGQIDTMLSNFILPLQASRKHIASV